MIFVDFSARDLRGRFYVVRLGAFPEPPELGQRFIATDLEEFDGIECKVIGINRVTRRVYYRPVNPAQIPGTSHLPDDDLYEEDEPIEEIRAAFEAGEKGVTRRPVRGVLLGSTAGVTFRDCRCEAVG